MADSVNGPRRGGPALVTRSRAAMASIAAVGGGRRRHLTAAPRSPPIGGRQPPRVCSAVAPSASDITERGGGGARRNATEALRATPSFRFCGARPASKPARRSIDDWTASPSSAWRQGLPAWAASVARPDGGSTCLARDARAIVQRRAEPATAPFGGIEHPAITAG